MLFSFYCGSKQKAQQSGWVCHRTLYSGWYCTTMKTDDLLFLPTNPYLDLPEALNLRFVICLQIHCCINGDGVVHQSL
jgi:hypothetical protein